MAGRLLYSQKPDIFNLILMPPYRIEFAGCNLTKVLKVKYKYTRCQR